MDDLNTGLREIKTMIESQGQSIENFKAEQGEKIKNLEKQFLDTQKKANRPGGPGNGGDWSDDNTAEGVTLRLRELKTEAAIASAMRLSRDDESPRISEVIRSIASMPADGDRKSLTIGSDPGGGYTVPGHLMPGILAALTPASAVVQAGARVVMLPEKKGDYSIAGVSAIPTAAWRAENGAVAESEPAFRLITQTPKSLAFFFKVSRELLMDSPGIDAALNQVIGQAFAIEMDRAGLFGSGSGSEPRGLANWPNVNTYSMGTNGAALASYSPVVKSATKIAEVNGGTPSAAVMAPRTYGDFADLVDTTGQPLRRPEALQSVSFLQTSQIPVNDTQGTSNDASRIFTGDFSQLVYHMREGVNVQVLTEKYADTGQVGFLCHSRLDIAVLYAQAFTIASGVRPKA